MADSVVASFIAAGLPKAKAETTAKNADLSSVLADIINRNNIVDATKNAKQGNLLLHLANSQVVKPSAYTSAPMAVDQQAQDMLVKRIVVNDIQNLEQLSAGLSYLSAGGDRSSAQLNKACGIGITITSEEIGQNVRKYIGDNLESLKATSWASLSSSLAALKVTDALRWANPLDIKKGIEAAYTDTFGSKEEYVKANTAASKSSAKGKQPAGKATDAAHSGSTEAEASTSSVSATAMFEEGWLARLHPVGGNPQQDARLCEEHMKATQGKVHTRFPPEPNGYLHIGHSKAIAINFGFAQFHGGHCYLRFDDTNPETEEQVYIDSCIDIVRWLGFEPWKITYSSDHFQLLYDLAKELIKRDKAYMCYCSKETIQANRGGETGGPRKACEHRNRPTEESFAAFEKMKEGGYEGQNAVLRMKQDLEDPSPQMWDLVAYRTPKGNKHHHRTGNQWTIYPTYDYTHCLCDSFENITHSLCTTEFIMSRQSYEWLCDALSVYKPRQSEYGRLKLQGTFLSKRKIMKLVDRGVVDGWDDPRLYTLIALRRRGIPPGAILSFINGLGVTTAATSLGTHRFEQAIRAYLETAVPRLMLVLEPLRVTLTNVPAEFEEAIDKPLHSKDASMGTNRVYLTRTVFIEASDFRSEDSKDFFRLAPGKRVGLLYAKYPIMATSFRRDESTGNVVEVLATYDGFTESGEPVTEDPKRVKTYIHWVSESHKRNSPVPIKSVNVFKQLFKSDDPSTLEGDDAIFADINAASLQITKGALVEPGIYDIIKSLNESSKATTTNHAEEKVVNDPSATMKGSTKGGNERVRFQALRNAYFCIDRTAKVAALDKGTGGREDSDEIVLNQIVSLKEDKTK